MAVDASITRILNTVRTHLPGMLDDVFEHEIYNVVDEFLDDTNIWRVDVSVSAVPNTLSYVMSVGVTGGTSNRLISVVGEADQTIHGVSMSTPGTLVLENSPSTAETYTATVALRLSATLTAENYPDIPSWIWFKYKDGIGFGVLARLMSSPGKPYFNERLAILNMRKFSQIKAQARAEVLHHNLQGAQAWRFPKFA